MIDALLDSARGGQPCAALRELWTVICTALEITAAQACERVFDSLSALLLDYEQYPATNRETTKT